MGKRMLTKEDIILLFLDNPLKLVGEIQNRNVPKSDEVRDLICEFGDANLACEYAEWIDGEPHPDTRKASCRDPGWAHYYARWVDKSPRSDTRQEANKDPYWKERYEEWENSLKKK